MGKALFAFVATAFLLFHGANAARACGSATNSSSYQWRVGDLRYDGADPSKGDGYALVGLSIVPSPRGAFFECVAQWPESWAGWYEGGSNIIWSDCIWTGSGPTYDTAVSFALDWKNQTMYLTHTFACSDRQGSDSVATASVHLDMDCSKTTEGTQRCILKNSTAVSVNTTQGQTRLGASSACTDNSKTYQSWQLEKWQRQYEMPPGSIALTPPTSDTGPSFTLRNMANTDVFSCTTSGRQNTTFDGTCQSTGAAGAWTTTAKFSFDPKMEMLTITQHWSCADSSSFDAVGVGFVQATCKRKGNMLNCTSDPVWIGTKTL